MNGEQLTVWTEGEHTFVKFWSDDLPEANATIVQQRTDDPAFDLDRLKITARTAHTEPSG